MVDGVVLLHGIFRTHRSMQGLARFLEKNGFKTLNLGYPSTRYPLEKLADIIHPRIKTFAQSVEQVHFIGYSMGGLLVRTYIAAHRPERLGRVVHAGVPNGGSEVADWLMGWKLYQLLYGPAGQQLGTDQTSYRHIFGTVDYDLLSIAGNHSIDPLGSYIIGKPSDGKVAVENTKLAGMKAHQVIKANHTFLPGNKYFWQSAVQFLASKEPA